jgi:hypothetical protein
MWVVEWWSDGGGGGAQGSAISAGSIMKRDPTKAKEREREREGAREGEGG